MSKARIGKRSGRGSWIRRCKLVAIDRKGADVLNPVSVRWYESMDAPELVPKRGDISYRVQAGDRMDRLATRFYGDTSLWWVISVANSIDEPAVGLHEGETIIIPAPSYVLTQIAGVKQSKQRGMG